DGPTAETTADDQGRFVIPSDEYPDGAADGPISVTATDEAGNTSNPVDGVLDTVRPAKPEVGQDGRTLVGPPEGSTGFATPGDTIEIAYPDGTVQTVTVGDDGRWSVVLPEGLGEGDVPLTVTEVSPAGNRSEPTVIGSLDLTPPDPPVVDQANGHGVSGTAEPGSKVEVCFGTRDAKGVCDGPTAETTADDQGRFVIPSDEYPDGAADGPISVTATDEAGNTSDPAEAVLDTKAPDAPVVDKANGQEIAGTAEPGSSVVIAFPPGSQPSEISVPVGDDGRWSYGPLPEGVKDGEMTLVSVDPAGNTSDHVSVDLDATAPAAGSIDSVDENAVTGSGAEPGAKVEIAFPDGTVVTVDVDGDGNWTVPMPSPMPDGKVTVVVVDEAGNRSDPVEAEFKAPEPATPTPEPKAPETTAPATPTPEATTPAPQAPTSAPTAPATSETPTTAASTPAAPAGAPVLDYQGVDAVAGCGLRPGQTVAVTMPDGSVLKAVPSEDGCWRVEFGSTRLGAGERVSVTVTDADGNVSEPTVFEPAGLEAPEVVKVRTTPGHKVEVDVLARAKSPVAVMLRSFEQGRDGKVAFKAGGARMAATRLSPGATGVLVYRPLDGFTGVDQFAVTVANAHGVAKDVTVQVTVADEAVAEPTSTANPSGGTSATGGDLAPTGGWVAVALALTGVACVLLGMARRRRRNAERS
ncbi:MAG: Ig-like domain-containing protein, partial [Propionibacteriaceae bacterium]|nr:Ig-like domain-containing protein [Propionibacteriaceae bacterium]